MVISAPADFPDDGDGLFAGRYRLIAVLKRGGMGVTYRAWDTRLGTPVVIKMPNEGSRSDNAAMRRFAREIEAMRRLEHDHIVSIVNYGEEDGCPFAVIRFLPGGSLADMCRQGRNGTVLLQSPATLPLWLPSVASALDFVHGLGLLHRDVKPGNIFFDGFWNAFLGDFGIAKVVDDSGGIPKGETLTATMANIGTPEYMAPELFQPKAVPDGRSDQYSLAVTVYEILAGEKPFTGSVAHIVVEQSTMPVRPLASRAQGLPASLCAAVEKALAKRPEDRFKTCGEFVAAALRDVLPSPREPNMARLLCPSCSTILRMPTSAGGMVGKCPKCKSKMRIATDLSALWLDGEEDGEQGSPSGQQLEAVAFEPAAGEPQGLVGESAASPAVETIRQRRQLMWMLAAVLLPMLAGLLSHMRWNAYHEWQIAALSAEQIARSQAAEGEWQRQMAVAEERIATQAKTNDESETLVKKLREEVAQLEMMLDESEAVVKRLQDEGKLAKDEADTSKPEAQAQENNEIADPDDARPDQPENSNGQPSAQQELPSLPNESLTVDKALRLLSKHCKKDPWGRRRGGPLLLDNLTTLSAEVAAVLATYGDDLSLKKLTALSPEAAEALAKHNGNSLHLDGLTALSPEAAAALAKHKGKTLHLDGLAALSPEAAEALAGHDRHLHLSGLTELTSEVAAALAKHQGDLHLHGVVGLTPRIAEAFWGHQGEVCLKGLATISDETAEALALHPGNLNLPGLTTLTNIRLTNKLTSLSAPPPQLIGLTTLSPTLAEILAKRRGPLFLDGLTTLPSELAEVLSTHEGELSLSGISSLSDEAAAALAKHRGSVRLPSLTVLTSAGLAAKLARDEDDFNVNKLTTLSPRVAKSLVLSRKQGILRLDGVVGISDETASELAIHAGSLSLNGLTELSESAAMRLAGHRIRTESSWFGEPPASLSLDGLTTVSNEVAEAFSRHEGILSLGGLTTLSAEMFAAFAKHRGVLRLNGVVAIADSAARELVKQPTSDDAASNKKHDEWWEDALQLNGMITLTDVAAEALASFVGDLHLNGLTSLSDEVADKLSKHYGALYLNGLTALSAKSASAFATHNGDLYLDGLTSLSDEVAEALAESSLGVSLDGVTVLSDRAANALAKRRGDLSLDGLEVLASSDLATRLAWRKSSFDITVLSEEAANALAKQGNDIHLPCIASLSVMEAKALSRHPGELHLSGLVSLSPEVASAFAEHQGTLDVPHLMELSEDTAEALGNHQGKLWLNGLTRLSDKAAEGLVTHKGELQLEGLVELSGRAVSLLRENPKILLPRKFE